MISPQKSLLFKIRNLIMVNENISLDLPPELEKKERIHKNILLFQIQELIKEMIEN